jgi:hypothetical protein
MVFLLRCLTLMFVSYFAQSEPNSNAVNERLPVRKAEMETHWQVDCARSWANKLELRGKPGARGCILPPDLLRQLQLCAFIYQPPGGQAGHTGPDYRGAFADTGTNGDCE